MLSMERYNSYTQQSLTLSLLQAIIVSPITRKENVVRMQLQMNQSKCQRRQPSRRMVVSSSEEDIFDGRCLLVVIGLAG